MLAANKTKLMPTRCDIHEKQCPDASEKWNFKRRFVPGFTLKNGVDHLYILHKADVYNLEFYLKDLLIFINQKDAILECVHQTVRLLNMSVL